VGFDGTTPKPEIDLSNLNDDIAEKRKQVLKYEPTESHMWNT
jgi:hypothetical protein